MAVVVAAPPQPKRLRVLHPYIGKLQEWNDRIPGMAPDRPATVLIGQQRLPVESWERRIIAGWSLPQDEASNPASHLVMESLACMAKSLTDIERLGRGGTPLRDTLYRGQAELLLDTAIGTALLRELRQIIDALVAGGDLDEARQWNSLVHRMRRVVARAMERVTESNRPRVQVLADSLTGVADVDGSTSGEPKRIEPELESLPALPKPPSPPQPRRRRAAPALRRPRAIDDPTPLPPVTTRSPSPNRLPSRTIVLAGLLVLAILLWAGLAVLPAARQTELQLVTIQDFAHTGEFLDVAARPPSLFIDVDPASWSRLGHAGKWSLIRKASAVVSHQGYDGLLIRDPRGVPLGQWLRGRGVLLLDGSGGPQAEPAPASP